jgi:hypothetical protein
MLRKISAVAILGIMLGISQGALWAAHPPLVPQEKKEARRAASAHSCGNSGIARCEAGTADSRHDFGGHRVEAVAAVDNAMKQLQLALQYDKQ